MTCPSCGYYLDAFEKECPKCGGNSVNNYSVNASQQTKDNDFLSIVWEKVVVLYEYFVGWMKKSDQHNQIVSNPQAPSVVIPVNIPTRSVTCPQCYENHDYPVSNGIGAGIYEFTCPSCNTIFVSRIVTIRSKNSRGSKKENIRRFSVRVYDYATGVSPENLIEFVNHDYYDFEMKSGDLVIFSYYEKSLKVVQNTTINRSYVLK